MANQKNSLRKAMLLRRRELSPASVKTKSEAIARRLFELPEYCQAAAVALYWPILSQGEVDTRSIDAQLRANGKRTYYPVLSHGSPARAGFAAVQKVEELRLRGGTFKEPAASADSSAWKEVDLVIVPAVVATAEGQRLGFGSGFYDRVLPRFSTGTQYFILAYELQLMTEIPTEEHDFVCHGVITEQALYRAP